MKPLQLQISYVYVHQKSRNYNNAEISGWLLCEKSTPTKQTYGGRWENVNLYGSVPKSELNMPNPRILFDILFLYIRTIANPCNAFLKIFKTKQVDEFSQRSFTSRNFLLSKDYLFAVSAGLLKFNKCIEST